MVSNHAAAVLIIMQIYLGALKWHMAKDNVWFVGGHRRPYVFFLFLHLKCNNDHWLKRTGLFEHVVVIKANAVRLHWYRYVKIILKSFLNLFLFVKMCLHV